MEAVILEAQPRQVVGKKVRELRRQGVMPLHLYGRDIAPITLQADAKVLQRVMAQVGHTAPVTVRVNGDDHFAFVREIQRHPVKGHPLHVDFLQVSLTERLVSQVPITLAGDPPAARIQGASLLQSLHYLEVESLPMDVPSEVTVDISTLDTFEKAIHASDISLGPNVTILTDPETVVARVVPPRAEKEEAVEEAPVETEVVTKGKEEEPTEGEGKE